MKKKLSRLFIGVLSVMICMNILSCNKMFDVKPKEAVDASKMYRNVFDADAAVIGVYGKFMGLAKQYVVLNEVRADLMDVTTNADVYLKQLNTHSVTTDNPYADPRPFYEVIMNCNDVLKNFNIMLAGHKMSVDEYNQRYSDVGTLRSWLYLQLGIQYGSIPYVTDPIATIEDLKDASKFPKISFDQLLDNLLQFTEALPYKSLYATGSSLLTTYDTYNTGKMFINKAAVLGDLNLWKGNWVQAATYYYSVMQTGNNTSGDDYFGIYRIDWSHNYGSGWGNLWSLAYGERYTNYEIIWDLPFDKNFSPGNPFINMFSSTKDYLLKPSDLIITAWKSQNDATVGRPEDARGNYRSYRMMGGYQVYGGQPVVGKPEIIKYTAQYDPLQPFATNGKWILYRCGNMFMHYSEAVNRTGRDKLAMAFVNGGISNAWDSTPRPANVTNLLQSRNPFTGAYESAPFAFDARNGTYPYFRGLWHRNVGLRSRAGDRFIPIDSTKYFATGNPRVLTNEALLRNDVEDNIINELALETAFEGNRWSDLMRIALRRKATDPNYLSNKVGAKLDAAHDPAATEVRNKLKDPANWYLPFKLK